MININWDSQPLGQMSDDALASILGVSKNTVLRHRKKRNIPPYGKPNIKSDVDWDSQPLGEISDAELAIRIGLVEKYGEYNAKHIVGRNRRKRGIPSYISHGRKEIDWDIQPLGKIADRDLADILNCRHQLVAYQRKKRGIPKPKKIRIGLSEEDYCVVKNMAKNENIKSPEIWLSKKIKELINGDK